MNYNDKDCKGCRDELRISDKKINKIFEYEIEFAQEIVTDRIFKQRIQKCKKCSYLDFESTCRYDGKIVQIKAKLADEKCELPDKNKWEL